MRALGFDSYMEFLQSYLKKYRQSTKQTKGGGSEKPLAPGAHKRGRKARGGDEDDEPDHSTSPVNVPSEHSSGAYSNSSGQMMTAQALFAAQQQAEDLHNSKRRKGL